MLAMSARSGTSESSTCPSVRSEAANIGSAAFFEPWTSNLPAMGLPPSITNASMRAPPNLWIFLIARGGRLRRRLVRKPTSPVVYIDPLGP